MRKIFAMAKTVFKGDLTENGSIILRPVPPKPCMGTVIELAQALLWRVLIFAVGVLVGVLLW